MECRNIKKGTDYILHNTQNIMHDQWPKVCSTSHIIHDTIMHKTKYIVHSTRCCMYIVSRSVMSMNKYLTHVHMIHSWLCTETIVLRILIVPKFSSHFQKKYFIPQASTWGKNSQNISGGSPWSPGHIGSTVWEGSLGTAVCNGKIEPLTRSQNLKATPLRSTNVLFKCQSCQCLSPPDAE